MRETPETLILIAGRGDYPLRLAQAARTQGVERIFSIAFKGETSRHIKAVSDEIVWLNVGSLGAFLAAIRKTGAQRAVMAGQINPKTLTQYFLRVP